MISIDEKLRTEQTTDKIWISYKKLFNTVTKGAVILLDDGAIEVTSETVLDKAFLYSPPTIVLTALISNCSTLSYSSNFNL